MINKTSPALVITETDIEELVYEWNKVPGWVKSHVAAKSPARRYEGELLIDDNYLIFCGRDLKEDRGCELVLPLERITGVDMGFSEYLKDSIDPAFGIGGPVPVAVHYTENGEAHTLYFNTNFKNYLAHGDRENIKWFETLAGLVKKNEPSKFETIRQRVLVNA